MNARASAAENRHGARVRTGAEARRSPPSGTGGQPVGTHSRTRAGALIETARIRAELSQTELAARAHTSQAAISDYERGRKTPSLSTLERILSAAGFELRMTLAATDDHDESLERYMETLPAAARKRFEREQRSRRRETERKHS